MFENIIIKKIYKDREETQKDTLAQEIPLTINVNNRELATLLSSPADLRDLTVGFLYSSGLIKRFSDIENIVLDTGNWTAAVELIDKNVDENLVFKRLFTSGCGRGVIFYSSIDLMHRKRIKSDFNIEKDKVIELMQGLQGKSIGFKKTGGVHAAALSDGKNILIFREDIGRHSAIDKVIGQALIKGLDFSNCLILSSGRISSEIVFKVKKANIPIIVSQSAPTDQAVKLAREFSLTLIGFVRGSRMNVYSAQERLISQESLIKH